MLRVLVAILLGCAVLVPAASPTVPPRFDTSRRVAVASRVVGFPDPPPAYRTRRVHEKLVFKQPLHLASNPRHDRLFVVEQAGRIVSVKDEKIDEFLKVPGHDFYGMTFHPKYAKNGYVYVFSNGPNSAKRKKNAILRYKVSGEPPRCEPESRFLVIEWESNGHNGGDLGFGPDGMLYITSGDGTSDSDGDGTGQDLRDLNSGMIRIDVDGAPAGKGYLVPPDNPFLKVPGAKPELWAFGLRNPWRMTFDRETGDLYIADIGQDLWEMIYLGKKGANYGWSIREGTSPFHPHHKKGPAEFVAPLIEHPHSESRSITGGIIYRGKRLPALRGAYIYGDYATGRIWGLRQKGGKVTWKSDVAFTRLQPLGFTEGPDGELYLVEYGGQIHTLEAMPPQPPQPPFPRKLSQTGLFTSVAGHVPHPGMIPYSVNAPLWSDGADKDRFLALPGDERITFSEKGAWKFPEKTAMVKTFRFGERRVETRIMVLQQGEWAGFTYEWNAAQDEAHLVDAPGKTVKDALGTGVEWHYPSRSECMVCHSRASTYVLGVCTSQLNRDHDYGDGVKRNQLVAMEGLGLFTVPLQHHADTMAQRGKALASFARKALPWSEPLVVQAEKATKAKLKGQSGRLAHLPDELPRLADPSDKSEPLEARARAYLHSNCAHCHVWAGGGNAAIDLHINTARDKMKLVGVDPLHDKFGILGAKLVAPGAPEKSVLYERLKRRGRGQMPPLGSGKADAEAVRLLSEWIRSTK